MNFWIGNIHNYGFLERREWCKQHLKEKYLKSYLFAITSSEIKRKIVQKTKNKKCSKQFMFKLVRIAYIFISTLSFDFGV